MLRPIPVNHYLTVARRAGLPEDQLLQGTEIRVAALADPDYMISQESYIRFLSNLVQISGDNGIGLDVGLHNEAAHYGVLAYSGMSCKTIRQGMEEVWTRYGVAFGVSSRLRVIAEFGETETIEIAAPRPSEAVYRFIVEEALCVLLKIGGALTGMPPPFEAIQFSFQEPSYGYRYQRIFQCPVIFNGEGTLVSIKRSWLEKPLETNDAELNRLCREHLERVLCQAEASASITLRLKNYLMSRVGDIPSLEDVARDFGVSSRTLARQLSKENCNYRQLTEDLRCELALKWLTGTKAPAKEIAYRLGFKDASSFRRAFKEWTGQSVNGYRHELRSQQSAPEGARLSQGGIHH